MKQIPDELTGVLVSTSDTLHGAVRFAGTRVFAHQLVDYLLAGEPIETFLEDFEGVTLEQAETVRNWMLRRLHQELELAA